jgi:hypothetical protein
MPETFVVFVFMPQPCGLVSPEQSNVDALIFCPSFLSARAGTINGLVLRFRMGHKLEAIGK